MAVLSVRRQKWAIRIVTLTFVMLCANALGRMAETPVIHRKVIGGLITSLVLNASLLLSLFLYRSRIRYALGVLLVPSALGVAFLLADYHLMLAAFFLLFHLWLVFRIFSREAAV